MLEGPRLSAKQTHQPSVVLSSVSVPLRFRLGHSFRVSTEQPDKSWTVQCSEVQDWRDSCQENEILHIERGFFPWQMASLIFYQGTRNSAKLRSTSNLLFWDPHCDNKLDFNKGGEQTWRLNWVWMRVQNSYVGCYAWNARGGWFCACVAV